MHGVCNARKGGNDVADLHQVSARVSSDGCQQRPFVTAELHKVEKL
jgi:hypothetical protein